MLGAVPPPEDTNMASKYRPRHRIEPNGLDCAVCGHDRIVASTDRTAVCPNCEESYAIVSREEFTLLESDGWTTRVTFDGADALPSGCSG